MPTTARLASLLLLSLPLATLAACDWNEVETGRYGQVEFVPDECGQAGCDLDDGIAAGAELTIGLRGVEGRSTYGLGLVSSAPWVVDVIEVRKDGFDPEFRILGTGAGTADLIAIDGAGYEVDYIPVEVATISELGVDAFADGLTELNVVGADHAYSAPIGADLQIHVSGLAFGRELTGFFQYFAELDSAIALNSLSDSAPSLGFLHLSVPAGEHEVRFTAPGGTRRIIRVIGR
jgi:hypothetical protein